MAMTLMLSIAGVLILRPLTKRIGDMIELRAKAKHPHPDHQINSEDMERLTDVVSRLTDRIESLEERQDFAERLLYSDERATQRSRSREPLDG
jgi:hypothetical protein